MPALLLCDPATSLVQVAGLVLLDRLVVAAHRAGCNPIYVLCADAPPAVKRARALQIPIHFIRELPTLDGPVLLATSSVLVGAADIRRLLRDQGRLTDHRGAPLPIGLARSVSSDVEAALQGLPEVTPRSVACLIRDPASAKRAESALWASVKSSADGWVDRVFNRPCGRPLSKLLVRTPASPNAISLTSTFIGLVAAWFFAAGSYTESLVAALLFQISAIVDCVDGEVARVAFKESPLGKWIDLAGDQVVHIAVFGGIALGLMKSSPDSPALWLGLSAILGALLSFGVVVRGLSLSSDPQSRLQKLIDAATNRDFSVLVLLLTALGQLDLFLWITAAGSHVFWMTALALQWGSRPSHAAPR